MKIKYFLLSLLVVSFITACSDDDGDTKKPQIEITEPADHAHFHPGETFVLKAEISDNVELASWKVDIHYDSDGHAHKSAIHEEEEEVEWNKHFSGVIEPGLKYFELELEIQFPANAKHGDYHIGVYATDKAGNEQIAYLEIEVEDDEDDH
jgi:hypothetical protein